MPNKIKMPKGTFRNSIAIYYLTQPRKKTEKEVKHYLAQQKSKKKEKVLSLIKKRANEKFATKTYRMK